MMTSSRAANPLCAARSIDQIGRRTSRSALGIRFQTCGAGPNRPGSPGAGL